MDEQTALALQSIFLGWFLGLLGPLIVDSIRSRRENNLGRKAIRQELVAVAAKLGASAFYVRMNNGTISPAFLKWLSASLNRHGSVDQETDRIAKRAAKIAEMPEDQMRGMAMKVFGEDGKKPVLQVFPVPLLDARVTALASFHTDDQRTLLSIRTHLALISDLVDRQRRFSEMTFQNLGEENRRRVTENIDQNLSVYAEAAERVAKKIFEFVDGATTRGV